VSFLPQAPEAAGEAEYIVLAEAVAQDQHSTVPLATYAQLVSVATARANTLATVEPASSSGSQRPPVQWGVGIPLRPSSSRGTSSRSPIPDPAAQAGGPPNLDEFVNGPLYNAGYRLEDVDVDVMVADLIYRSERLTHESSRMRGVNLSGSAPPQGKRVNQNDITKMRARLATGDDARVAIVLPTIATRVA
jgi:hypothetical protein